MFFYPEFRSSTPGAISQFVQCLCPYNFKVTGDVPYIGAEAVGLNFDHNPLGVFPRTGFVLEGMVPFYRFPILFELPFRTFNCNFCQLVQCFVASKPCYKPVSYTHLRAHETDSYLVCRLLLEKKKKKKHQKTFITD